MARYIQRRWDPFRDLGTVRDEMNRLVDQAFGNSGGVGSVAGGWSPALDVRETPEAFVVTADLPGMTGEDVEVTFDQNVLTITGERRFPEERTQDEYVRVERRYGRFLRSFSLPTQVDPDGIQASFAEGVLEITIPKAEQAKPRKIKVGEGARQLHG